MIAKRMNPWDLQRVDKADSLAFQIQAAHPLWQFEREYRFAPPRQYRIDIAFVLQQLAVEVDGGIFTGGRHVRGAGVLQDCEKTSLLAIHDWRLIRVAPTHIKSGEALTWIELALRA